MNYKNFTLDPFQEEAIRAIENNKSVVVSAPTGSGKTLIADFIIEKHKNDQKRIVYTAPIKALSNQKYKDFCREYGEKKIGLLTGDVVINPDAKILIMTTEIYRNMVVGNDDEVKDIAYVIFDEIHYINDLERGYVWEESIIYSHAQVRFLCLSATIPNAQEFSNWIKAIKKHEVKTVIAATRHVPLKHLFYDYELGITTLEKINEAKQIPLYPQSRKRKDKIIIPKPSHLCLIQDLGFERMPCMFFTFSRKDTQLKARELARKNLFKKDKRIIEYFCQKMDQAPHEVNRLSSTVVLKEVISQGIAFHHAGLLPLVKETVEELFAQGLIKVLYTTETFAVGINMPAKTVCFNSLRKYDGVNFRLLNTKEYFQIAGRAGRRGIDSRGYVVSMIFRPTFKYQEVKTLTSEDIEPIKSQFRLSVNTVLNLLDRHTQEEIEHILRLSFYSYQEFGEEYDRIPTKFLLARYNSVLRKLRKYHYIEDNSLTEKGCFSSKIFADEIVMGEIFATDFVDQLNEYQILLLLAALVYEPRYTHKFEKEYKNDQLKNLNRLIYKNEFLSQVKQFANFSILTSLIYPIYHGQTFFDVMKGTNLLEGDLIRIYAQIMDRLGQIKKAAFKYERIRYKIENAQEIIRRSLEGIYLV